MDPKVLGFVVAIAEVVGAVLEGLVHVDHHPLVVLCPWSQTFLVQNHKHPLWQGDKIEQTIPSHNAHCFYLLSFPTLAFTSLTCFTRNTIAFYCPIFSLFFNIFSIFFDYSTTTIILFSISVYLCFFSSLPHLRTFVHHLADWFVVEVVNVNPLDAFTHILGLFSPQHQLNKQLLELLVAVVDAKLLKTAQNNHRDQLISYIVYSRLLVGPVTLYNSYIR